MKYTEVLNICKTAAWSGAEKDLLLGSLKNKLIPALLTGSIAGGVYGGVSGKGLSAKERIKRILKMMLIGGAGGAAVGGYSGIVNYRNTAKAMDKAEKTQLESAIDIRDAMNRHFGEDPSKVYTTPGWREQKKFPWDKLELDADLWRRTSAIQDSIKHIYDLGDMRVVE